MTQFSVAARRLIGAARLSMCIVSPVSAEEKPFATLDGKPPLVIGHRGLPGLMPEETQASYDMAAALGTDALEEDLHLTKDCVLVARHNPWLSDNTNVAEVAKTNPEVAASIPPSPRLIDGAWSRKSLAAKFRFQGCCCHVPTALDVERSCFSNLDTRAVRMEWINSSPEDVTSALAPGVRACAIDPAMPSAGRQDASGQSRAASVLRPPP
jgi:hypothetical protein